MKEILFFLFIFLLLVLSSEIKIYNLKKYGILIYEGIEPSLTVLETTNIKGNEINITYSIKYSSFLNEELNYSFIDDYPDNDKDFIPINSIISNERTALNNELKLHFSINKEKHKYLILQNLLSPNQDITKIELKNIKNEFEEEEDDSSSNALTAIIVISIISVFAIVAAFVFVGKYIFDKRQKEIMSNYASSFVDDKSSLLPNNESKNESNDNKEDKKDENNNNDKIEQ